MFSSLVSLLLKVTLIKRICNRINSGSRRQHDYVLMSRPKLCLISRLLRLQIDMFTSIVVSCQTWRLFQIVKTPEPVQHWQRVRLRLHVHKTSRSIRLRVRIELSCRACNSRRECDHSPRSRRSSRRRLNNILHLTLCIYVWQKVFVHFPSRVFHFHRYICKIVYICPKYTSCYPGPNIVVSTHCYSVLLCKYNWIYSYSLWD